MSEVAGATEVTVSIDAGLCAGAEYCVRALPEVFALSEDGVSTVGGAGASSASISAEFLDRVREAAFSCPTQAIGVDGEEDL